MKKRRVLLKLSGEVLGGSDGVGVDAQALLAAVKEIRDLIKKGVQVAVVVGGGNFWRYRDNKMLSLPQATSDAVGMLATLMNARVLAEALNQNGIKAVTLSAHGDDYFAQLYSPDLGKKLLNEGFVVLCAGGTGNPYFTTDTAAALRALELDCDLLLKGTKVEGVYDSDPFTNKKAKFFAQLSYAEVLKRELLVMDLTATQLCKDHQLPVRIFNGQIPGNVLKAALGKNIGTLIS